MVEQQPDPVTGPDAPSQQMARELVGLRVQVVIGQDGVAGVHSESAVQPIASYPVAPVLKEVIEAFAGRPANGVFRPLANQDAVSRRGPVECDINKISSPRTDDAPLIRTATAQEALEEIAHQR